MGKRKLSATPDDLWPPSSGTKLSASDSFDLIRAGLELMIIL